MTNKEALDYLYEMWDKYHKTKKIEGFHCLTKESCKWFDSIVTIKKYLEEILPEYMKIAEEEHEELMYLKRKGNN